MKAIKYDNYGAPQVLQLAEVKKPVPTDHELLVKIQATSVTAGDCRMRSFDIPIWFWVFARLHLGVFRPKRKILGMELSGVVEAVGEKVTQFKTGDAVYASTLHSGFGAYAEYKCFHENSAIALKPENVDHTHAATLPIGAGTALRFLKKETIEKGQRILIYGASGSVGTYAVQLAKHYGAQVTAACSRSNAEWVKALGADEVIDYTSAGLATTEKSFDLVFDAVGKMNSSMKKTVLKKGGRFLTVLTNPGKITTDDLKLISTLVESNAIKPVVENVYSIHEMALAHTHVDSGRKKGNVAVKMDFQKE